MSASTEAPKTDSLHLYILDDPKIGKYCPGCAEVVGLLNIYSQLQGIHVIKETDWEKRPITTEMFSETGKRMPLPILELPSDYRAPDSIRGLIKNAKGHQILVEEKDIAAFFHEVYGIPKRAC